MPSVKKEIRLLNSVKNGVPFDEIIIQLWHFIFGQTNKHLAQNGMIRDTYSTSIHQGYVPAICYREVKDILIKKLMRI
jgi:nucleoside diphosphate kinase